MARVHAARRSATSARVTHAIPGRMRVRVSAVNDADQDQVLGALAQLSSQPGVTSVTTDSKTGSALIAFDPDELDLDSAMELVRSAHEALADIMPPALNAVVDRTASDAAMRVQERFTQVDQRVMRATHGAVDLRMLVPIGLAGLSIRQVMRQGLDVKSMPWYMLAYYSFDTFIKLHSGRLPGPGSDVSEH